MSVTSGELTLLQQALANKNAYDAAGSSTAGASYHAQNQKIAGMLQQLGSSYASSVEADSAGQLQQLITELKATKATQPASSGPSGDAQGYAPGGVYTPAELAALLANPQDTGQQSVGGGSVGLSGTGTGIGAQGGSTPQGGSPSDYYTASTGTGASSSSSSSSAGTGQSMWGAIAALPGNLGNLFNNIVGTPGQTDATNWGNVISTVWLPIIGFVALALFIAHGAFSLRINRSTTKGAK